VTVVAAHDGADPIDAALPGPDRLRVAIIGIGLMGGSLGRALRAAGHVVIGCDLDDHRLQRAVELGAIDEWKPSITAAARGADVAFVAVPVLQVADAVVAALDAGAAVVSDMGSVKGPIVDQVRALRPAALRRFVAGHPMAGSEQTGVEGADPSLFTGRTWVLAPTPETDADAYATLRTLLASTGADVVAVEPDLHDELVAVVSHVPHLAAGTLMRLAADRSADAGVLLRLAAGGFRDMTRIAAGDPGIWPDICAANRGAIVSALDEYLAALGEIRDLVAAGDRPGLFHLLEQASRARRNLPVSAASAGPLVELRIPVPDRPGVFANITTALADRGVSIFDLEVAHSAEGGAGVLVIVVAEEYVERAEQALADRGHTCSVHAIG
jgi:prephenate dehydrogenase